MDNTSLMPWQVKAVDAADAAYRAGYHAGYQAAVAQIIQTAQAGMSDVIEPPQSAALPLLPPKPGQPPVGATRLGRATPGAVKKLVRNFVLSASGPVTERQLGELHPEVNRSSRYMAFRNLAKEGVIARRGDAWVPAPTGEGNPGDDTPG